MQFEVSRYAFAISSPLGELSQRYPTVRWTARPLGRQWLVRAEGPPEDVEDALREAVRARARRVEDPQGPACLLLSPSRAESRRLLQIEAAGGTILPPLSWSEGSIIVRVAVPLPKPGADPFRPGPGTRLLSRRKSSLRDLLTEVDGGRSGPSRLSERQLSVLREAIQGGYYDVPRKAPLEHIAARLGIQRSTAEEHLRRGESILLGSFRPLLDARASGEEALPVPTPQTLETYARFSHELDLYVQMILRNGRISHVRLARSAPLPHRGHPYLARILHHIQTGQDDLTDLPVELDVSGFDREVLEALRRIPPGETITYGALARLLGHPRSARAVGNAVARNPISVVIPCHRVVPAQGGIGNYSAEGGSRTKETLLRQEGATIDPGSATVRGRGRSHHRRRVLP